MPSFKSLPKAKTGRNTNTNTQQPPLRQQPAKRFTLKKLLMLLGLIVIVMLTSIGITLYLTWPASASLIGINLDNRQSVTKPIVKKTETSPLPSESPLFLTLDPFTSTISDGSRSRIFYVAITPQVSDEASIRLLEEYKPVVRDRVLRILSEQHPIHVQTPEGRQQLVDSLINSLSNPYGNTPSTKPRLRDVLFTAFVIQ